MNKVSSIQLPTKDNPLRLQDIEIDVNLQVPSFKAGEKRFYLRENARSLRGRRDLLRKRYNRSRFPNFSLNRTTIRLKIENIWPRFSTFSQPRSPWWKSVGSRYERHGARCKAPRRRRCSSSIKEWQRRSWPHAVVTRRAQGSSGHRLCHSSVTMTKHRSAPHFAPETRIPLRATLQTSTTGS